MDLSTLLGTTPKAAGQPATSPVTAPEAGEDGTAKPFGLDMSGNQNSDSSEQPADGTADSPKDGAAAEQAGRSASSLPGGSHTAILLSTSTSGASGTTSSTAVLATVDVESGGKRVRPAAAQSEGIIQASENGNAVQIPRPIGLPLSAVGQQAGQQPDVLSARAAPASPAIQGDGDGARATPTIAVTPSRSETSPQPRPAQPAAVGTYSTADGQTRSGDAQAGPQRSLDHSGELASASKPYRPGAEVQIAGTTGRKSGDESAVMPPGRRSTGNQEAQARRSDTLTPEKPGGASISTPAQATGKSDHRKSTTDNAAEAVATRTPSRADRNGAPSARTSVAPLEISRPESSDGPRPRAETPLAELARPGSARTETPRIVFDSSPASTYSAVVASTPATSNTPQVNAAMPIASSAMMPMRERDVTGQIVQAASARGTGGVVNLTLDPPELGRVEIVMEIADQGIRATLTAERQMTGDMIRRHAELLAEQFQDAGFDDIDLAFHDQDAFQGTGPGVQDDNSDEGGAELLAEAAPSLRARRAHVADGSIDMRL